MIIVDAHCDTITRIIETNENLYSNKCHIDIKRMKSEGKFVQFFAAFIKPVHTQAYSMRWAIKCFDRLFQEIKKNNDDMMLCCNYIDIDKALESNRIAAILSIEDGIALQGELSALRCFYDLGARSICLTWNNRNEIADGCRVESGGGLTRFGRDVIREMNKLGMLIDVSHLSEKGFWDVMEESSSPIIASHSNAQKICHHVRNLNNEQLNCIRENNGAIGINFCPDFLNDGTSAGVSDIIRHIEYIISVTGIDHVGLGADLDGIDETPNGISGVQDINKIFNELFKLNYSQEDVEKIAGKNFLRVIKDVL